jgi:ElaB/YqjD/DUF883 family membrane-anchored ribosome-binding protein
MNGDTFNMSGDFRGANVNVKSTLTNVSQTVGALPNAEEAVKAELQSLLTQLNDALQEAGKERPKEAEAVAQQAGMLVETATKEHPNPVMVNINAEGLKRAAETLASITPAVLTIVTQIIATILKLG